MIIVVSGASGFIGRRLLKNFTAAGYEIRVLSRHTGTNMPPGVRLFAWDPLGGPPPRRVWMTPEPWCIYRANPWGNVGPPQ